MQSYARRSALILTVAVAVFLTGCRVVPAVVSIANADYIDIRTLDLRRVLPPAPSDGSDQTQRELAELLQIQKVRTAEQCERAAADVPVHVEQFSVAVGLTPAALKNLPKLQQLSGRLRILGAAIMDSAKRAYARPRPFRLDTRVQPCIERPASDAYPGGHATWAYMTALVLADMLPEKRSVIMARADEFARSRVLGGVHYPSDNDAGRLAGTVIAAMLFASPQFAVDAAAAGAELRAALPTDGSVTPVAGDSVPQSPIQRQYGDQQQRRTGIVGGRQHQREAPPYHHRSD